ncbi:MAG TPA: protein kinase, partial [Anaerolineales bacterium]|nr:protein kinase [Anaerolineales bacterium]
MPQSISGRTFLNQYAVEEFIVLTPLGDLYRATDTRNNKPLALTLLPKIISENPESLKELELRSNQLRGLSHPNIVPCLGLYQTPTLAFVLEEWIDGPSLKNILGHAPVGINESLIYTKAVCGALEALHKNNYLHLHLSPELIHIDKRGKVYISGLAFSRPIAENFTDRSGKYPHLYFAPEQFFTQPLAAAADIYALAVL